MSTCLNRLVENLPKHLADPGWAVVAVHPDGPDGLWIAYTVGLWDNYKHPEVVMLGLPAVPAQSVLNTVGDAVKNGRRFEGSLERQAGILGGGYKPVLVPFNGPPDTIGFGLDRMMDLTREDDPAWEVFERFLQLVWPDTANRLPWEPEATGDPRRQPVYSPLLHDGQPVVH